MLKKKKLLKKHFHKPENKQSSLRFYFIYNTNMAKSQLQKVLLKKIRLAQTGAKSKSPFTQTVTEQVKQIRSYQQLLLRVCQQEHWQSEFMESVCSSLV